MSEKTNVNFRMDSDLKKELENVCDDMGLSITVAFNIFAKKVVRERRIPFEINSDPFYSKENMEYLEAIKKDIDAGQAHFSEHELLEE